MEPIRETYRYDVFLSFRGGDTRDNFTSHLHGALKRNNFHVFHDTSLRPGSIISHQLLESIKGSRIFVVLFSTNYADSKWCLDELAQMMYCMDMKTEQIILPIFLDVNQSDVGTQQGSYEEALTHHEKKFDPEKVQKWREALRKAGEGDHGLHLQKDAEGNHEELMDQIVEKVRKLLHRVNLNEAGMPLVGIESRIQDLISLLNSGSDDVGVVAICGPAGIGKTTIAKATYDYLSIDFKTQYSCFLTDVKTIFGEPNGKVTLQKMLLSSLLQDDDSRIRIYNNSQGIKEIEKMIKHQKVLLVLDDVDNEDQLNTLSINNRALLGRGSRIIVTTRDQYTVGGLKQVAIHEPRLLDENESWKVFCMYAFGQDHPKNGFAEVSRKAADWGAGNGEVLKKSGVYLRRFRSVEDWQCALTALMHNSSCGDVTLVGKQGNLFNGV